MKTIKCAVCQQKKEAASPTDDMCKGCRENYDRVYGDQETTMSKAKTAAKGAKNKGGKGKAAPSKINPRKAPPAPKEAVTEPAEKDEGEEEEAPESTTKPAGDEGTEHNADDHGGTPHDDDASDEEDEADESEEEEEEEEEEEQEEGEEPAAGASDSSAAGASGAPADGAATGTSTAKKTYQWRMRQLSPAKQMIAKLKLMLGRSKRFNTSVQGWENPELAAAGAACVKAIGTFIEELEDLPDTFKPPRGTTVAVASKALEAGAKMKLREKHQKSYDDVLDEAQVKATFVVVSMKKSGKVVLDVPNGESTMRVIIPRGHLIHADEPESAQA